MTINSSLLARRKQVLGPAYRLFYDKPLHLVRGGDSIEYLDAYNNVPSVGHCHPMVVQALSKQAATLNTHTRYVHETMVDFAEQLLGYFAPALSLFIADEVRSGLARPGTHMWAFERHNGGA